MSEETHEEGHHDDKQPVLIPFILLWVVFGTICFIGNNFNGPIETLAGEYLAKPHVHHTVSATPVQAPNQ